MLELPQLLRVVRLHAAKLTLPTVPGRLGDLQVTADLGQVFDLVEQFVALGDLANYLFGGVVLSLHGDILSLHEGALGLSSAAAQLKGIPEHASRSTPPKLCHSAGHNRGLKLK